MNTTRRNFLKCDFFTDNKEGLIAIRVDRAFEELSDKPELFTDANGNETGVPMMNNEGVSSPNERLSEGCGFEQALERFLQQQNCQTIKPIAYGIKLKNR